MAASRSSWATAMGASRRLATFWAPLLRALIPYFGTVPFQNGVDVYMPATDPPDGTITFSSAPRGDPSQLQVLNTPNWASDTHRIVVNLNDYVQDKGQR